MSDLKHEVTAQRWAALIKERMDSGITIKEWCQERNIKESQYYYWLRTLRRDEADAAEQDSEAAPFVELPVICREQEFQPGKPAGIIRKGDVCIETNRIHTAGFLYWQAQLAADRHHPRGQIQRHNLQHHGNRKSKWIESL